MIDEMQDDDEGDIGMSELGRLKDFARGRAGAELGTKLGLPPVGGDDEVAEGEAPMPAEAGGDTELLAALQEAGVPPEKLQAVLEALKAAG